MKRLQNHRPGTTRRVRLRDYDYHTPGYYFVTICTTNQMHLFGEVNNLVMHRNDAGNMIDKTTAELSVRHPQVEIDAAIIMPNHVHLLLGLNLSVDQPYSNISLVDVMHWWKTRTTNRYIAGVKKTGWQPFDGRLWQVGYHDHIIRNDRDLEVHRRYIVENPSRWGQDIYHDWSS